MGNPSEKQSFGQTLGSIGLSAIPVVGGVAAAALQRSWALKDLAAQNRYNSPAESIKRHREAGLPLASMFSGGVGSQSEQPRTTNVDPTLGTAKGLETYFQNRLQKMQIQLLEEQVNKTRIEASSIGQDANQKALVNKWLSSKVDDPTLEPINQFRLLDTDRNMKQLQEFYQRNENKLKDIEVRVQEDLERSGTLTETPKKQLLQIINDIRLQGQRINVGKVMDTLIKQMEKGGMSTGEAFIHSIITGLVGTKFISR